MLGSIVVALGMTVYGVLEYRRRETQHRERMSALRRLGQLPVLVVKPELWKTVTTGVVAFVAFTAMVGLLWAGLLWKQNMLGSYAVVAGMLLPIVIILVLMVLRDIRRYRHPPEVEA